MLDRNLSTITGSLIKRGSSRRKVLSKSEKHAPFAAGKLGLPIRQNIGML